MAPVQDQGIAAREWLTSMSALPLNHFSGNSAAYSAADTSRISPGCS
jgi:hypothetical protein